MRRDTNRTIWKASAGVSGRVEGALGELAGGDGTRVVEGAASREASPQED